MNRAKTRIVATIGPASATPSTLRQMIEAGVDVVRLNFSHGTHDEHAELFNLVRSVSREVGEPVAILQDLCGPKMRVGVIEGGQVTLHNGDELEVVESLDAVGTAERITIEAVGTLASLKRGQSVLLADGLLELRVVESTDDGVRCKVVHGGVLRSRQGVHFPGARLSVQAMTDKDREDLRFGLDLGVDAVALSFVRSAEDILELRRVIAEHTTVNPFVIAKIERAEALDNLDAILEVSSGVMVARGDLGVELGVEKVPIAQKHIIATAQRYQRPVITATQMLESMIENPTATRAEVSDVANAVLEGTDALMLSGETAIGQHPVRAVRTLAKVARQIESSQKPTSLQDIDQGCDDHARAASRGARVMARAVCAAAIIGFTNSGRTVRLVSNQRPQRPLFGVTSNPATLRRMKLFWGVTPLLIEEAGAVGTMIRMAERLLIDRKLAKRGSAVVIVCGEHVVDGATNTVKIHTLGKALAYLDNQPEKRHSEARRRAAEKARTSPGTKDLALRRTRDQDWTAEAE